MKGIPSYFSSIVCCTFLQNWESHLKNLFSALSTESDEENKNLTNDTREKITALYGANAEKRTFEDLKNDDKFSEITNHLSSSNVSFRRPMHNVTFDYLNRQVMNVNMTLSEFDFSECNLISNILLYQASDFARKLQRYIQYSPGAVSGGWYWPLVKCVTIKIPDCHELLEHITLVDLPGTGDCNKIRDEMWKSVNMTMHCF